MSKDNNDIPVYGNFRFWVEIDGLLVATFSEISGLTAETDYEKIEEGGVNSYLHYIPTRTKYPPLVFKRGITTSRELWDWYYDVANGVFKSGKGQFKRHGKGNATTKDGSITLVDYNGKDLLRWHFHGAYPVKWSGPELRSMGNEIAFESIELVHHGLKAFESVDKK